jgi:hypothetical protein
VRLQRILLALAVATTVALASGCAKESGGTTSGAPAAASPTVDPPAVTEAACKAFVAAFEAEKAETAAVLTDLVLADISKDEAALAAVKAKGEALASRLAKVIDAETAKLVNPAAKAAFTMFMTTFAKSLTLEGFKDDAMEAEKDKATAEVQKFCPALPA